MNRKKRPEPFYDWHRAFVQMMMSRGMITGQEMFCQVKSICERFRGERNFPDINTDDSKDIAEMIEDMYKSSNKALEPLQLRVGKIQEEEKKESEKRYTQYYVLAPAYENEQLARLQSHYGERELEWLKLVAEHLVASSDKVCGQNELVNLCTKGGNNSTKKKLNVTEADKALQTFTAGGYLMKVSRVRYGLGPRFMVEMEKWMKQTFEDEIWECGICKKIGMIGKSRDLFNVL